MTATLRERLIGAWKLVSCVKVPTEGSKPLHPTHSMFVSPFPNWIGQTQPRVMTIEGEMLKLDTASPIKSGGKETNSCPTWTRAEPKT